MFRMLARLNVLKRPVFLLESRIVLETDRNWKCSNRFPNHTWQVDQKQFRLKKALYISTANLLETAPRKLRLANLGVYTREDNSQLLAASEYYSNLSKTALKVYKCFNGLLTLTITTIIL